MHKVRSALLLLCVGLIIAGCSSARKSAETLPGSNFPPGSVQEFSSVVGDRVFFETDSSALSPSAQQTLNKQITWLKQYSQYRFVVEGHADERGTREYNIALGGRRAAAVKAYLVANGISQNRFSTISYGKERPVAVCNDISCWSQNRRAVTVLQ